MGYKYTPADFGQVIQKISHIDLALDFLQDKVRAECTLHLTGISGSESVVLDATDLEIESVTEDGRSLRYTYEKNRLAVRRPLRKGGLCRITAVTYCRPSDTLLEGIYKDETPAGAPQQYISQCQQWGFQRIAPVMDDCRQKCTFRTTLRADERYTHLISNGDVCRKSNPDARPKKCGNGLQQITYVNDIPMAPYLFIAAAGTWDELADSVTYPSGRTVRLEYLVPPGRKEDARLPMEILKKSVLWVAKKHGYEYEREAYRTICMTRSNFGGMENVGNTTIVTDSALVDSHTLDMALVYAHAVIVHEFFHNRCGSETTMATPFDMWLNEAYTVHVERQFLSDTFDPASMRLSNIARIRDPLLGPLAIEEGGAAQPISRNGFNHPDELVDGLTYIKAAEVVRMLSLLMGREKFAEAADLYFRRYSNRNADTGDFFECFEEVWGKSLKMFKECWLRKSGYPVVRAECSGGKLRFCQENGVFHLPVQMGFVDSSGNDIKELVFEIKEERAELKIGCSPAFVSMNRDYSFYGILKEDATEDKLRMQAMLDPNLFNRAEAARQLTERQRLALMNDRNARIDRRWTELYGEILDSDLPCALKSRMLAVDETPLTREYVTWYQERVFAREALMKELNRAYRGRMLEIYQSIQAPGGLAAEIEARQLKAVLLSLISADDTPESHSLLLQEYQNAACAQEKVSALYLLNKSSCQKRREVLNMVFEEWKGHPTAYSNYLRIIAAGEHPDVIDEIEHEIQRECFDKKSVTGLRSLLLPFIFNTRMLWTGRGTEWLAQKIIEFSPLNTMVASRMLNSFQHVRLMKKGMKENVLRHLQKIAAEAKSESVKGQAALYIKSA